MGKFVTKLTIRSGAMTTVNRNNLLEYAYGRDKIPLRDSTNATLPQFNSINSN